MVPTSEVSETSDGFRMRGIFAGLPRLCLYARPESG
jgi:hypothetical protein